MSTTDTTNAKLFAAGVIAMVLVAAVLLAMIGAGLRVTEVDRAYRTARAEACRSIEDEALRTLCLVRQ